MDITKEEIASHPIVVLIEGYWAEQNCTFRSPRLFVANGPIGFCFAFQNESDNKNNKDKPTIKSLQFRLKLIGIDLNTIPEQQRQLTVAFQTRSSKQKEWSSIKEITNVQQRITEDKIELSFEIEKDILQKRTRGVLGCLFHFSLQTSSSSLQLSTQALLTNLTHPTNQAASSDIFKLLLSEVRTIKRESNFSKSIGDVTLCVI
jgi:hypothetical protein